MCLLMEEYNTVYEVVLPSPPSLKKNKTHTQPPEVKSLDLTTNLQEI